MIQHVWSVLSSRSVIDQDNNNVSLQNVLEQLVILQELKPRGRIMCPMQLTTLWCRVDNDVSAEGRARVTLVSPTGEEFGSAEYAVDLSIAPRHRQRTNFDFLPVDMLGRYVFIVEQQAEDAQWQSEAVIPLQVLQKLEETAE